MFKEEWSWDNPDQSAIILEQGEIVFIKGCWGFIGNGLTNSKDFQICVDETTTMKTAVESLRHQIYNYVRSCGGDSIRHYYIEDVIKVKNGYEIIYGT